MVVVAPDAGAESSLIMKLRRENSRLQHRLKAVVNERRDLEGMLGVGLNVDSVVHRELALMASDLTKLQHRVSALDRAVGQQFHRNSKSEEEEEREPECGPFKSKKSPPASPIGSHIDDASTYDPSITEFTFIEKVFRSRPSVLDVLLLRNEFKTVYHACLSVLFVYTLDVMVENLYEHGHFLDLEMLFSAFYSLDVVLGIWLLLFCVSLTMPGWLHLFRTNQISSQTYKVTYCFVQLCLFSFVPTYIRYLGLPIGTSTIALIEQIRFSMKMHSFFVETYRMTLKRSSLTVEQMVEHDLEIVDHPVALFKQYHYFLWAPTLVYRNTYPRLPFVRWRLVLQWLSKFFMCIWFVYCVFKRYCAPVMHSSACTRIDSPLALLVAMLRLTLPTTVIYITVFVGLLHCWLNVWAELLKFGDRHFYDDWWNSVTFSDYYRKFNVVCGDWLYTYAYRDFLSLGLSSTTSILICFAVSALAHEYVLTFCLGIFFPMLSLVFVMMNSVHFVFSRMEDQVKHFLPEFATASNFLIWTNILLFAGAFSTLYAREWYARSEHACLGDSPWSAIAEDSRRNFPFLPWVPLSLLPFMH